MFIMLEVSWESREECCVAGLPWAVEVRGFPLLACSAPEWGRGKYKTKTTVKPKQMLFKRMVLKVKHCIILK